MADNPTKQAGDVLYLPGDIPDCDGGNWVLLSVGERCCLSRLAENEAGKMCMTNTLAYVALEDMSLFISIGVKLSILNGTEGDA